MLSQSSRGAPWKGNVMQAVQVISRRSLDDMETEIITLVREFDLRQCWRAYYFNNCAEWLNMKCGVCIALLQASSAAP